jgi:hypothetical protein
MRRGNMGLYATDPKCIKQQEFVNIPAWDRYTGKGITIFHDDKEVSLYDAHAAACKDIIQTILPEARVLTGRIDYSSKNNEVTHCTITCAETKETLPFDEFVTKYDVSQINNSTDGGNGNPDSPIARYMRQKIKQYNLFCTGSAGNFGSLNNKYFGAFVMVTGVYFYKDTDRIEKYGVAGDGIDFAMFMGFQSGTSFSSPFTNGMGGKLRDKYGRQITQEWIYEYFKNHCQHLGTPGKNPQYGWGVPILGNSEMIIKMQIGSNVMTVDGNEVKLDQPPEIVRATKRTLVPIRAISEAFGATVDWDEKTKTITIIK